MKTIKLIGVGTLALSLLLAIGCGDSVLEKEVAVLENQKEIAKNLGIGIIESQNLISENKSQHFYKVTGFNKDSLSHWICLQKFSKNMIPDAISTEFRFYDVAINGNDIDLINHKFTENYIARGNIVNSSNGYHWIFEATPMGSKKHQCPERFESKVGISYQKK